MDKVEIGEYVRLDDGTIGKYDINKNWINVVATNTRYVGFDIERDVVKHSKNLIDLIEAGDMVNGEQIDFISKDRNGNKRLLIRDNIYLFDKYKRIKSILTKEMYEQNCYRLEVKDE